MPDEEHTDGTTVAAGEGRYLLLVGGLLLIIGMALGWLWTTERSRRIAAERRADAVQVELDSARAQIDVLMGLPRKGQPRQFVLPRPLRPASRPRD